VLVRRRVQHLPGQFFQHFHKLQRGAIEMGEMENGQRASFNTNS
jgi:hypothetical protein